MDYLTLDLSNTITFVMVDSSGTEVSGLGSGFTLQLSKNGGAFAASSGTKAEIGSGWYKYTFTVAECNTAGPMSVRVTGAGCVQQNLVYVVQQATSSAVWANSTRTLTQTAASSESTSASKITRARGSTWSVAISGLVLSGYTTVDFVLKDNASDTDLNSVLWVRKNSSGTGDGLLRLNKSALVSPIVSTDASISVDESGGIATITVNPAATKDLSPESLSYAIQTIISGNISEQSTGTFVVTGDIVRAVS